MCPIFRKLKTLAIASHLLLLLAACGGEQPAAPAITARAAEAAAPLVVSPSPTPTAVPVRATTQRPPTLTAVPTASRTPTPPATATPTVTPSPTVSPTPTAVPFGHIAPIGVSAGGLAIESIQFGSGADVLLLVGGMHGGYEWNSILLAYAFADYFLENPAAVPDNLTLFIIPSANPDGQLAVTGSSGRFTPADVAADTLVGRFNANHVDLNRNWPCRWTSSGTWRDQTVSGGPYPLSEPENAALRDFIFAHRPRAIVFYHSAFGAIFTASCTEPYPLSLELAGVYAGAATYPVYEEFSSYPVTGDAGDALAVMGFPSFTVELSTHQSLDWAANLAGMRSLLAYLSLAAE